VSTGIDHIGNRTYRFKDNPLERVFSEAWQKMNDRPNISTLEWNMGDGSRPGVITQRDATVAASVIQWLGSHVGQCFLADVLGQPEARPVLDRVRLDVEPRTKP
jgi:hypothetical protein